MAGAADPSTIHVLENGPVRLVIEVKGKLLDASTRSQQIVLYQDLPRIDLATSLDWEGKRDVLLYQMFPLAMPAPTVRYAVPYGWEEYGKEMNMLPLGSRRPRCPWPSIAAGECGDGSSWPRPRSIALASQCNYAAFKDLSADPEEGFLIQPLLLRTVRSCGAMAGFTMNRRVGTSFALRCNPREIPHAWARRPIHPCWLGGQSRTPRIGHTCPISRNCPIDCRF